MQHSHFKRALLAGFVSSLMAVGLVVSPAAFAETYTFRDPAYDIRAGADIVNVRVTNERRVVVVVRHRDLRRGATPAVGVLVDTNRSRPGPELSVDLNINETYVWAVRRWKVSGDEPLACRVTGGFDYKADVTRVGLGRDCLHRWGPVRVSVWASAGSSRQDWAPAYHRFSRWVQKG